MVSALAAPAAMFSASLFYEGTNLQFEPGLITVLFLFVTC
jgi:hypothetical protein